jgi:hypothetical protein
MDAVSMPSLLSDRPVSSFRANAPSPSPPLSKGVIMFATEESHFDRPADFMTVRHLTLRGSQFDIGRHLGRIAMERYGRTPASFAADPLFARTRRRYVQRNFAFHWGRMQGIAAALGVDPEDDSYDLTGLPYLMDIPGRSFFGCSVVYYPPDATAKGHGYLSRNYDFPTCSLTEMMQGPLPAEAARQYPAVMSEPYVMAWYPEDGGYASLAMHAFDLVAGTLDGMNSAGLVVSIVADEEAQAEMGPRIERHPGPQQAIGLHELAVMRLLLDTCADVPEAREALLSVKQYYRFIPCQYIVGDRSGRSFVYANSTGRNIQHVIEGHGQPQLITNFQLHKHRSLEAMPAAPLTVENNAFWRYRQLADRITDRKGPLTPDEMKANNACVNTVAMLNMLGETPMQPGQLGLNAARTVWHSLYDTQTGEMEASFHLGDGRPTDGKTRERRSAYLKFALEPS